jgi:hypothetical protein
VGQYSIGADNYESKRYGNAVKLLTTLIAQIIGKEPDDHVRTALHAFSCPTSHNWGICITLRCRSTFFSMNACFGEERLAPEGDLRTIQ